MRILSLAVSLVAGLLNGCMSHHSKVEPIGEPIAVVRPINPPKSECVNSDKKQVDNADQNDEWVLALKSVYTDHPESCLPMWDKIIADYSKGSSKYPSANLPRAYLSRGSCHKHFRRYEESRSDYEHAISLADPADCASDSISDLARDQLVGALKDEIYDLIEDEKLARAKDLLAQLRSRTPSDPWVHSEMAFVALVENDLDNCVSFSNRALELDENYHNALSNRGSCYFAKKEFSKAVIDMSATIATAEPNDPQLPAFYAGRLFANDELQKCPEVKEDLAIVEKGVPQWREKHALWLSKSHCLK